MMTALLSWLSKSSSASLHHCHHHLRHRCHPRHHRYRQLASSTGQDSSQEQRLNYLQILDAPH